MSKKNIQGKDIHLRDYIQPILRRKWILIISFIILFATVTITSSKTTSVYKAKTQVMIDIETPNIISFEKAMSLDSSLKLFYQTQYKILSSRSLALRVIDTLNLKDSPEFKSEEKGKPFGIKDTLSSLAGKLYIEKESNKSDKEGENTKLIDNYLKRLKVEPIMLSRLVNISFEGVHPDIITKIVNKHVEEYVAQNLEVRSTDSQYALRLLQKQLYEKKEMVEKAENALQLYKEREKIVSIEERQDIVVQRLEELSTALTDARTERMGIETLNNLAIKYSETPGKIESIPEVIKNPLIKDLKRKYVDLSTEIIKLSDKYGRNHPEMIRIASKANELKDKIKTEVGKIIKGIEVDYNMALAKEENLSEALEDQKEKALELNRKAITYGTLKREVETERAMYAILLNKLKETDIKRALMTSNINIVDPAEVPQFPIKPMKSLNMIIGAIVGLGLGIGIIFFLEHYDDTIKSPEDIQRYLGLSLLGAFEKVKMINDIKMSSYDIITHKMPRSNIAEAYRITRTNIIFFGAPPSMIVTDAVVLSNMSDGVIFVVKYGEHEREAVERAISQITDKGHEVIGVVMNYIDVCSGGYCRLYPSSYRYGYYNGNGNVSGRSKKTEQTI